MAGIAEIMIGGFDFDFIEGRNGVINWDVEGISVEIAVGDAGDGAKFLTINLSKATGDALGGSGEQRVIELIFLRESIALFAHVGDDVETELASLFRFTMMLTDHGDKCLSEADEANAKCTMLNDISQFVIKTELFRAEPVPLPHEEGEVADVLIGLEFETFVKLAGAEIELLIEFFIESGPVGFFAFAEADAMFDADADEVDSGERTVATASDNSIALRKDRAENAGAAAHSGNFGAVVAGFIILQIERCVNESEIRKETLGGNFHTAFKEVVIGIFGIVIDAFFDLEDGDGENGSFALAETFIGGLEEIFADEAARGGSVSAEVNRGEGDLGAGARVHGVEVVNEALHGLESLLFDIFVGSVDDGLGDFELFKSFVFAIFNIIGNFYLQLLVGEFIILRKITL